MGYESTLHLINIKIKTESLPVVSDALITGKGPGLAPLKWFLELAVIDSSGFLCFKASEDGLDPYVPDDEGTVPALSGKWKGNIDKKFASWIKFHSEEGGRIVLHSIEGDGAAWGWEFDGKDQMRELQLCSVGEWI